MRSFTCFLWILTLTAGCVLEDKFVEVPDGSVEAGPCGFCDSDAPACNETTQTCVPCTDQNSTACTDDTPVCNAALLECVQCVANLDCDDPTAPRCNTDDNECVQCEGPADCDGIEGLSLCNGGTCVECIPATEDTDCEGDSCNPDTFTCTDTMLASRDTCETCVSDSECANAGNRCVAMEYQGAPYPDADTGFCLKTFSMGDPCEEPFLVPLNDRRSLSGPPDANYCGINEAAVTCSAVYALLNNVECLTGEDDECPTSGLCRDFEGGVAENRCTYLCGDVVECKRPPAAGSTCGSSGTGGDDYCGG